MAVDTLRKAPTIWNSKWLRMSSYSLSLYAALQHGCSKFACSSMAGSKDGSPSSVHGVGEFADIISSNQTRDKTCTYTKKEDSIAFAVSRAHELASTSMDLSAHTQWIGLTRDLPKLDVHRGFFVCFSHVMCSSQAMARVRLCTYHGCFCNMVNYARAHSTGAKLNTQSCPCGKYTSEKGFLICPECNTVQAPNPAMTYFQIFDLDEKFELDLKDLEVKYKRLMKKLHPDLSHGKSPEEKENYAQLSALVTTAYNELLKTVSRATYILKLRGVDVEEEGTVTDSELIMEVMEIRESLQSSPDRRTLEQLQKTASARMGEWSEAFKSALKGGDDTRAVGALQRMSYFGRVCDDINRELL